MLNLWVRVEVPTGASLQEAVESAIAMARRVDSGVVFRFNSLDILVAANSTPDTVVKEYSVRLGRIARG